MRSIDHTGAGSDSFHNILRKHLPENNSTVLPADIKAGLNSAYADYRAANGGPDMWPVAQEWLRVQGF